MSRVPAFHWLEHDLLVFRRGWHSYLLSGLSQPFLYLLAMGLGLGLYVNRNGGAPGGVPYLNYLAPALLITQAMMAATAEAAWPVMAKIVWDQWCGVRPQSVLAVPVAVLTGLAFAAPIMALTATLKSDNGFNVLFRFGITPLFLFSGTFFPISKLPLFLQPVAWITPLYHGVDLGRSLSLGQVDPIAAVVDIAVLMAFVVVGIWAARITFRRRLEV